MVFGPHFGHGSFARGSSGPGPVRTGQRKSLRCVREEFRVATKVGLDLGPNPLLLGRMSGARSSSSRPGARGRHPRTPDASIEGSVDLPERGRPVARKRGSALAASSRTGAQCGAPPGPPGSDRDSQGRPPHRSRRRPWTDSPARSLEESSKFLSEPVPVRPRRPRREYPGALAESPSAWTVRPERPRSPSALPPPLPTSANGGLRACRSFHLHRRR